jgi:hypothetical protein
MPAMPPEFRRIVDTIRAERLRDLIAWCDEGVVKHSPRIGFVGNDHIHTAVDLAKRLVEVGLAERVGEIELIGRSYSDQSIVALLAKYSRILNEELSELEQTLAPADDTLHPSQAPIGPIRADRLPLFPKGVPDDPDLVDLVARIDAHKSSGKSRNTIARELTGETAPNDRRAQRLLRQLRRMQLDGRVNLS